MKSLFPIISLHSFTFFIDKYSLLKTISFLELRLIFIIIYSEKGMMVYKFENKNINKILSQEMDIDKIFQDI